MTTKLYELSDAYRKVIDSDELTHEEIAECLNNIQELFDDKAVSIGKLVLSEQADIEAIESEIKRLSDRKKARENRVKGLKFYLQQEMEATGTDKVKHEVLTISLRNSPPSVQVVNEEILPKDYWRIIPERREVDKESILSTFKESGDKWQGVPGVEIITDKKYVSIR